MDRGTALKQLQSLKKKIEEYQSAKETYENEQSHLDTAQNNYPYKLKEFDKQHFRKCVNNREVYI